LTTVANTDTIIRHKTKTNWRQKVKSTFQSSRPNSVTNSKQSVPPQGTRVAFLAVKVDADDVTNIEVEDVSHFDEKLVFDSQIMATNCEVNIEAKSSATSCVTSTQQEGEKQVHAFTEQDRKCDFEHENVKISTVLGQVHFCNGTLAKEDSLTRNSSENHIIFCPDSDVTDQVTTISVDVHNLDTLRGNFKASPVSSAGPECSCGESCPCSSYDSDEERPGIFQFFPTSTKIICREKKRQYRGQIFSQEPTSL
jgi:hypothetical protein